ncbi:class I adenylate-forming enzyme family protein [Rubellicoccus peritrichatus]|uniref:Class I adenylate-forming enzyme family protein n=1 Tax=Rubellicoccus peritrichatus TaxID=3080537 RepID=A0AAQ3LDG8_9BACT|nr:class I adenylate-forming enzyme family protein [Puniceicoccus sp. CR14]WOO42517.1 class I adenylate-forming enzyme family protein [Puniceicoccus sp. CR14]
MTVLQEAIDQSLSREAKRIALYHGEQAYRIGELKDQSLKMAAGLIQQGLEVGDRVGFMLPNCPEALITTLASYNQGLVIVPINYRFQANDASKFIDQVEPKLLVYHVDKEPVVTELKQRYSEIKYFCVGDQSAVETEHSPAFETLPGNDLLEAASGIPEDHPALILFTSGSTGIPKGVVHSQRTVFEAFDSARQIFDFNEEDVVLVGKSISHAGGLQTQLFPAFAAGSQIVLATNPSPAEAVAIIQRHKVTEYAMLASNFLDFVEFMEAHHEGLPSLRKCIASGDAVPHDLHERFKKLFGWEALEGCGMTEVGTYYSVNPLYGKRKWGSIGLPAPNMQVRVVQSDDKTAAVNETGELMVKSPTNTIGYWNNPEATKRLFSDGWLHTGDLGYADEDGYFWFVSRKKLLIVRRGSNISPVEIENVLDEHPLIHATVVVGVPDDRDGEVPVACIASMEDTNRPVESELREFVAPQLAAYKLPKHYLFLSELPQTATGKFDRHELEEMAGEAFAK